MSGFYFVNFVGNIPEANFLVASTRRLINLNLLNKTPECEIITVKSTFYSHVYVLD